MVKVSSQRGIRTHYDIYTHTRKDMYVRVRARVCVHTYAYLYISYRFYVNKKKC